MALVRENWYQGKISAMYLGTMLADSFDNRGKVSNRLGDCIATCRRMKLIWSKANISIKWKIQLFNTIIRSKLLYGLESWIYLIHEYWDIKVEFLSEQVPPVHFGQTTQIY